MSLTAEIRPIGSGCYQVEITGSSVGTAEAEVVIDLSTVSESRRFRWRRFKSHVVSGAASGHVPTVGRVAEATGADLEIEGDAEAPATAVDQDLAGVAFYTAGRKLYYAPGVANGSDNVIHAELLIQEGWE